MQMERKNYSVHELLELWKNKMLTVNSEYQRGVVWTKTQKKKLIDSVMRLFPLPLFYLHHIKRAVAGMQREDLEIIDGQQRIMAMHEFAENAYKLLDPAKETLEGKFPNYIKRQPCPWAGKYFRELSTDLQRRFLDTKIAVARIESDDANEVRDLFVRLQAGSPLNSQETRDAWPGDFTDFILHLGGKPEIARYPGHPFFQRVMRMKPGRDRGKTRQLAAQIAMLFLHRRKFGPENFLDINSSAIDDFYYENIDFRADSPDAKRLVEVLDKLDSLLGTGNHPKIRAHDAIHLVLLVDTLWDEYASGWQVTLPKALDRFMKELAKAKTTRDSSVPSEYWLRYGQWTRVNSDRGDRIRHRHSFYCEKMLTFLGPIQKKDPKRLFGELEREIIYFRDSKKCRVCGDPVIWEDAEIHHVSEHAKGGSTQLDNGLLVHKRCHPKGRAAELFAARGRSN